MKLISVEDRLPEDGCYVDVFAYSSRFTDVYFENGKLGGVFSDDVGLVESVTHWMPIPEPPKAAGQGERAV